MMACTCLSQLKTALAFSRSNLVPSTNHLKTMTILSDNASIKALEPAPVTMKAKNNDDQDDTGSEPIATISSSDSFKWLFSLVLPLQLVYISNQWSRSSVYYLVNFSDDASPFTSMNVDIGFSQAQYGLLASLAFTALFAFASLGAGAAADRFDRKQLTVVSALGWGVATLGTALSSTYTEVLSWRIIMVRRILHNSNRTCNRNPCQLTRSMVLVRCAAEGLGVRVFHPCCIYLDQ